MTTAPTLCRRRRGAARRRNDLGRRHRRAQRVAHAQRHDAVAGAGALSGVRKGAVAQLLSDRRHHLRLPAHRLASPAADRLRARPEAVERDPAGRHGLHHGRAAAARLRGRLSAHSAVGRGDRDRERGVPSRGLARRARCVGRAARLRPESLSGGREFRPVDGARCSRPSSSCPSASIRFSPSRLSR